MFSSSPAAVGWLPLHSNVHMTLMGSHHPQGPAHTTSGLVSEQRPSGCSHTQRSPGPRCKKWLSVSNTAVEDTTPGKYSDGLHPGDTFEGSPNWHSFFQKQHLPAPDLNHIASSAQNTEKHVTPTRVWLPKPVLQNKTIRHKLEVCMAFPHYSLV